MGKSRKFGMGNPGKLMPSFRHGAETMAESEGFGSSGRVDLETMLSEDSCSPKRKRISLNGDIRDRFGVPVQRFSLSKMSGMERKELEVKLRRELEEVRVLRSRVASLVMSSVVVSSTSDIPRMPERVPQGKKRPSPERNGPRLNNGSLAPPRQPVHTNSFSPLLRKQCSDLLNQMFNHKLGWVFKEPVDVVKLNIPDYFDVIKHPMDFTTIKSKLASGEYESPQGFAADVRLTFSNAMTYNPPKNDVHIMAQAMSKFFEQRWKTIEKKMAMNKNVPRAAPMMHVPVQNKAVVPVDHIPPSKKKKVAPVGYVEKPEPIGYVEKPELLKRVMTSEEKSKLSMELETLLADLPEKIIEFLKENSSGGGQVAEDEIEIDIDALSDDVLFKLRKLIDDFLVEKKKQQSRAEPCEMELHYESGFSNSSIQPGKGNDAADEDIDIGGNDHPVSSFSPVEIEKETEKDIPSKNDGDNRSSSRGGSGSSSSDSDSDSSTSEIEGVRGAPPSDQLQGSVDAKSNMDQHHDKVPQEIEIDKTGNSLNQVEHTPETRPPPIEVEVNKERGEIADSERQVSPDKLYRAALLRSRFADTILKAQEKTLEKGEKRDPESLRLEREELEKRQREEKARLLAEAKAAEESRRKAEAEAAAEAAAETQRKRELEREAARLALQQMEKTVEINENCQFMEDLKLLGSAPVDDLSNLIGNASPGESPQGSGLGRFGFQGTSNPLEQLGLFRKDYDDEDEDMEPPHLPPNLSLNDVEEGEID